MIRRFSRFLFFLGLVSMMATVPMDTLAANMVPATQSSFAGSWSGDWIFKSPLNGEDHTGTWTISVANDGGITGIEHDRSSGQKGELKGFIEEDGYLEVFLKYTDQTYTVKGTLTKRGSRLTGPLKQFSGSRNVGTLDLILKRE